MRDAGVKEILIVLGTVWPDKVREYYGDGARFSMNIRYITQDEPRGLAHAVSLAKDFVGSDRFVVYLGDNILKGGIAAHANAFASSKSDALVLLSNVSKLLYLDRFGVAKFNSTGQLEALLEKPKDPPSQYALVGVYFLSPIIFDSISKLKLSKRGELEITDAIQSLIASGRQVSHGFVEGWWKDTGTPEDILDANRLILDEKLPMPETRGIVEEGANLQGRVRIEEGALIHKRSTVRGPVHIGRNTIIGSDTYIGPYTSIGNACKISSCELENSIIMDRCVIDTERRITDSIIGSETEILGCRNGLTRACRLVLGERSRLQL
jgi:glucose-1-phosphate thymidylyltransferase